jgi:arylsulfatase A-like enzyme
VKTAHKKQTIRMVLNHSILKRASALALLLQTISGSSLLASPKSQPNVLVILADDLGYGDLSCFRQDPANPDAPVFTPHIDSLAAQGVKFTQAYATPMCSPSRASLLTGKYPQRFGFYHNGDSHVGLPREEKTFADVLRGAGYATACIGKWHVGNLPGYRPLERGFDRFYGFLGAAHDYLKPEIGTDTDGALGPGAYVYRQETPVVSMKYLTEQMGDEAIDFIRSSHENGKPFCLYLPFSAPHGPAQPEAAVEREFSRFPRVRNAERTKVRAMIDSMDRNVGRIMRELFLLGLDHNTLVVFASDNGGNEYERPEGTRTVEHNGGLRGRKFTMWEGGIRVPLILRWKGTLPEGGVFGGTCHLLDIFATLGAAANVSMGAGHEVDSRDLLPFAKGHTAGDPHEFIHATLLPDQDRWSVRKGRWKLIHEVDSLMAPGAGTNKPVAERGLFNLETDPGERQNLIGSEPEIAAELAAAHARFVSECPPSIEQMQKKGR